MLNIVDSDGGASCDDVDNKVSAAASASPSKTSVADATLDETSSSKAYVADADIVGSDVCATSVVSANSTSDDASKTNSGSDTDDGNKTNSDSDPVREQSVVEDAMKEPSASSSKDSLILARQVGNVFASVPSVDGKGNKDEDDVCADAVREQSDALVPPASSPEDGA